MILNAIPHSPSKVAFCLGQDGLSLLFFCSLSLSLALSLSLYLSFALSGGTHQAVGNQNGLEQPVGFSSGSAFLLPAEAAALALRQAARRRDPGVGSWIRRSIAASHVKGPYTPNLERTKHHRSGHSR